MTITRELPPPTLDTLEAARRLRRCARDLLLDQDYYRAWLEDQLLVARYVEFVALMAPEVADD